MTEISGEQLSYPSNWRVSQVGREFSVRLGKMLDAAKNKGEKKPYIGNRAVQWGYIDTSDLELVALTPADIKKYRLRRGDLLVCEGGDVGRAAMWEDQIPECYYQKALHRLRPLRDYDPRLMMYFLSLWASNSHLLNFVTQTSIAHLPKDKFEAVPLPVPPLEEQRRIVETLSSVDDLIESLDRLIAKKRDIKQGAIQQLLTGKMRLNGLGAEWRSGQFGEMVDVVMGQSPLGQTYNTRGDGAALINGPTEFTERYPIARQWTTSPVRFCRANDILICVRGSSTGRTNTADRTYCIGRGVAAVRAKDHHEQRFVAYLLNDLVAQLLSKQTGSTFPSIDSKTIREGRVVIPPPDEQRMIAQILSDMDEEITTLGKRLAKIKGIKHGLMQELLTGRTRLGVQELPA